MLYVLVSKPGVNAIQYAQTSRRGRDVGANLSHDTDKGNLADVGALSSHVGPGDDHGSPAIALNMKQEREGRRADTE